MKYVLLVFVLIFAAVVFFEASADGVPGVSSAGLLPVTMPTNTRGPKPTVRIMTPDEADKLEAAQSTLQADYFIWQQTTEAQQQIASKIMATQYASNSTTKIAAEVGAIETKTAAEIIVSQTMTSLEAQRLQLPLDASRTAAAQNIGATGTLNAIEAGQTATAGIQSAHSTELANKAAQATLTADAPLMILRRNDMLTQRVKLQTAIASQEAADEASRNFYTGAGKWSIGLLILAVFGFLAAGVYLLLVFAHNKKALADAQAARQRVINGGTTYVGNTKAQAIPQANSVRPLYDLSGNNGAGWAQSPVSKPTPPRDRMREKVGKFLLDASGLVGWGSDVIPSRSMMVDIGWRSDSEMDLIIKWLMSTGAVTTEPGSSTRVSKNWGTIHVIYQDLLSGKLQPLPTPLEPQVEIGVQNG